MPSGSKSKLSIKEVCLFGMFGALMYASKLLMDLLPNIHLIGVFIVVLTVVWRARALYPLYVFVFLTGLFGGFSMWWIPYLYIWAALWGMVMLIPRKLPEKVKYILYPVACSLHGFLYGTLYAPAQALLMHLTPKAALAWIAAGLPWDAIHGVSNLIAGSLLIYPLVRVIKKAGLDS